MPTSTSDQSPRPTRRFAPLWGVLLAEMLALSLLADDSGRSILDPLIRPSQNGRVLMFLLAALAVAAARPLAAIVDRPMPASPYAIAMLLAVVVGFGVASDENAQSGFPTRRADGARSVAGLLASDDIGTMRSTLVAFSDLRGVVAGTVTAPPGLRWNPYLAELAGLPVMIDDGYDPVLESSEESLAATSRFRAEMIDGLTMIVVGSSERYRVYYDDDVVALVAESDP